MHRKNSWNAHRILSVLGFILFEGILISLGIWQLQKNFQRNAHEKSMAHALHDLSDSIIASEKQISEISSDNLKHLKIKISNPLWLSGGRWIGPRTKDGKVGYELHVPFSLSNNSVVWVNLGWRASSFQNSQAKIKEENAPPRMELLPRVFNCLVRSPVKQSWFLSKNNPSKNLWIYCDPDEMTKAILSKSGANFYCERVGPALELEHVKLLSVISVRPKINHMGYAITWFATAFFVLLFALPLKRKKFSL